MSPSTASNAGRGAFCFMPDSSAARSCGAADGAIHRIIVIASSGASEPTIACSIANTSASL